MSRMDPRDLANVPPMLAEAQRRVELTGMPHLDELLKEVEADGVSGTWRRWRATAEARLDAQPDLTAADRAAVLRMLDRVESLLRPIG